MKFFYTLAFAVGLITATNANIHIVTCQNTPSHYLPLTVNAVVGDTIHWTWVSGGHIVGPMSASDIPAGAAMWSAPIDAGNLSFNYVVTVVGNYHYVCHPGTPHGEDAYIVVSTATGIQQFNTLNSPSVAYPNPFSDKITIESSEANSFLVYNSLGEKIKSFDFNNGQTKLEADLATLPKGVFFYILVRDGVIVETKKIVKD
jgi:plastocyanin